MTAAAEIIDREGGFAEALLGVPWWVNLAVSAVTPSLGNLNFLAGLFARFKKLGKLKADFTFSASI